MFDDDEEYPPEGGCLGVGAAHTVSERGVKKIKKNPIGFVHFKDPPAAKAKRARPKPKRRKR